MTGALPLELWGGIECTVNRVADRYGDQLERCGHGERLEDLDRVAELGIRTLRYPVLWERTVRDEGTACWAWADARLARLRELGIEPIVGLLHHGSGPRFTSLVDPEFPDHLARFAAAVARRYPWVRRWTPINEPLTTARFSALYGHWYPHARDDASFARAMLNQCRAVSLAMRAIRDVIPGAELVQTEDLGRIFGTPALRYQVEFENERRWLTFDALTGRLTPDSPIGSYLCWAGVRREELECLADEAVPPDIIGINRYLTSDRFLDDRLDRYPADMHGGNGRHAYVDTEAVRVIAEAAAPPHGILMEAWTRYGRPMAITEAHAAGTREQQLRWLADVWRDAFLARGDGADVRAVTIWALFGAFDWHALVTRHDGHYEPGAFDLRAPSPRRTALARMAHDLATTGAHDHPALDGHGWWSAPSRFLHGTEMYVPREGPSLASSRRARRLLITGASGTLGRALARVSEERGLAHRLLSRAEVELSDPSSVRAALDEERPWAVVNAAGFVRVDDAESEREGCRRDNVTAVATLAAECAARGVSLVTFSSDLVFDGMAGRPYIERDRPRPLNAYGASKAEAEDVVRALHPGALVIRTSAFFGPWDEHNFVTRTLRALEDGLPVDAADDEVVSPTYVPDLAHAVLDILIDGEEGTWHLTSGDAISWVELARRAARSAGLEDEERLIAPCSGSTLGRAAARPRYSVLGSERGTLLPPLDDALARFIAARAACLAMR